MIVHLCSNGKIKPMASPLCSAHPYLRPQWDMPLEYFEAIEGTPAEKEIAKALAVFDDHDENDEIQSRWMKESVDLWESMKPIVMEDSTEEDERSD